MLSSFSGDRNQSVTFNTLGFEPDGMCSAVGVAVGPQLPAGDISVVILTSTDTTLDHSQKAEKVRTNQRS